MNEFREWAASRWQRHRWDIVGGVIWCVFFVVLALYSVSAAAFIAVAMAVAYWLLTND